MVVIGIGKKSGGAILLSQGDYGEIRLDLCHGDVTVRITCLNSHGFTLL
jgi:hypothetical protein